MKSDHWLLPLSGNIVLEPSIQLIFPHMNWMQVNQLIVLSGGKGLHF